MNLHKLQAGLIAALLTISGAAIAAEKQTSPESTSLETGVFAGGCFWCVESDLEKLEGVGDVVSGYTGGTLQNPTYHNHEGHLEVVQAPYDSSVISYRELVDYFLRHIDPLDDGGQFCDRGHAYTTAIFYANDDQRKDAEAAIAAAQKELGKDIVTPVRSLDKFWIAEDYHQDYYKKNPLRYKFYRTSCGRDRRVNKVWGK
ncbi:MAG: peptide methionine sulfoxide reductase MsrA [Hyphococcus sp.]|nr:MAG: peptide methionine sulfoxide reductase MsrA [Marinicaulis sp.]